MGEVAFQYKEVDTEGLDTLEAVGQAARFNQWMYETILPFTKGRVLEIGSGIGNISQFFLDNNTQITLSDIRPQYCTRLKKQFANYSNLNGVLELDIVRPDFDTIYADLFNTFDSIFALNVVEHIENDTLALQNCYKLLKPGGKLTILVPAYQTLYNRFDAELYHYRRYNRQTLTDLFIQSGYQPLHSFYFNFVGILGWFVSGKLQQNKTIPEGQMKIFDTLVPIIRLVDKVLFRSVGLSVVVVGEKKNI